MSKIVDIAHVSLLPFSSVAVASTCGLKPLAFEAIKVSTETEYSAESLKDELTLGWCRHYTSYVWTRSDRE